jgi:hypothetical protein
MFETLAAARREAKTFVTASRRADILLPLRCTTPPPLYLRHFKARRLTQQRIANAASRALSYIKSAARYGRY